MQVKVCPKCGTENWPTNPACSKCSTPLSGIAVTYGNKPDGPPPSQLITNFAATQTFSPNAGAPGHSPAPTMYAQSYPGMQNVRKNSSTAAALLIALLVLLVIFGGIGLCVWYTMTPGHHGGNIESNRAMRMIKLGDTWNYDLEVTQKFPGMESMKIQALGSMSATVIDDNYKGQGMGKLRTFKIRCDVHSRGHGMSDASEDWYGQDKSGAIYFLGEKISGRDWMIAQDDPPSLHMPAVLTKSSVWGYTAHFPDNIVTVYTCKVVGTEWVRTSTGESEAYKVEFTREEEGKQTESGIMWVTPDNPLGVKIEDDVKGVGLMRNDVHVKAELSSVEHGGSANLQ